MKDIESAVRDERRYWTQAYMQKLFFASSTEFKTNAIDIAARVRELTGCHVLGWWNSDMFPPGSTTIESIETVPARTNLAVIFLTEDDKNIVRGKRMLAPRDNVIYETGFLMGALGRQRVALVAVGGAKIPSDLLGITTIRVSSGNPHDVGSTAEAIAKWLLTLSRAENVNGNLLPIFARTAVDSCMADLLGHSIYESDYVQFPLAAYPHFLRSLLDSTTFEMMAYEVISTRLNKPFLAKKPMDFDFKACHWYLYTDFPPNDVLDLHKLELLAVTKRNPRFTRIIFLPSLQSLAPLLAKSLRIYLAEFCRSKSQSHLSIVPVESNARQENQMILKDGLTNFRAERLIGDDGRTLVAFKKIPPTIKPPRPAHSVTPKAYLHGLEAL